jgi:hypothetical protein
MLNIGYQPEWAKLIQEAEPPNIISIDLPRTHSHEVPYLEELFHGTRLKNVRSILRRGLRVPKGPAEKNRGIEEEVAYMSDLFGCAKDIHRSKGEK